jgi:hypothetical protein
VWYAVCIIYCQIRPVYCTHDTILLTWSNTADAVYCIYRPKRALEVVAGRLRARDGSTMGQGVTSGCVVTVGSGMHHTMPCSDYILLPCGLHTGPILLAWHINAGWRDCILLAWHINDLKGPMVVYDNLIYLCTTLKDAANDVCIRYCLHTVSSIKC